MRKAFFFFFVCLLNLLGSETAENVEIFATKMETINNIVYIKDEVIVLYKGQYLSADRLEYDTKKKILKLDGNINLLKGAEFRVLGSHLVLDLKADAKELSPLFLLEQKAGLWMSAAKSVVKKDDYHLKSGMVSGCDPQSPLWKLYFSSADYNQKTKWMYLYNTRLHLYNIPIFYLPYFAYPTDTTRHSGLLFPSFGFSNDEGLFYEQPIYIALYDEWDLELRPQIRTLRGKGLYSTFRFRDSKVSQGTITTGFFQENGIYSKKNALAKSTHYGVEFNYNNVNWLDDWFGIETQAQSEFFSDIKWMNDVDYKNLASSSRVDDAAISEYSVVNMFYNLKNNYVGTYFKYFLDLRSEDSTHVIQTLPSLQYHHYLETFFDDYLLVNSDVRFKNYYRESGINAEELSASVPITLQTAFFENYIDLEYTLNNSARVIKLHQSDSIFKTRSYNSKGVNYKVNNSVSISSSLTKKYDMFQHNIKYSLDYIDAGSSYNSDYYNVVDDNCQIDSLLYSEEYCNFDTRNSNDASTSFTFTQYLFLNSSSEQILYHKVKQVVAFVLNEKVYKELENEFEIRYDKSFSLYSDTLYNFDRDLISQSYNRVSYNDYKIDFSIANFYANKLNTKNIPEYENYYIFDAEYRYNKKYKYFSRYLYDFENSIKKSSEIGFLYSKRCWSFGLRYLENLHPILSNDGNANSISEQYIYLTVELKPISGSEFNYKLNNNLQRN